MSVGPDRPHTQTAALSSPPAPGLTSHQNDLASRPSQQLIVLAGVVGSGKSTLSTAWAAALPGWVRVNQDDLGDRRACEHAVRNALRNHQSVLVDRQNFDQRQRRTWLEIAAEFPHVEVAAMVLGTSKEECRQRLLVRQDHPTIDNPQLAVQLLDKFSDLWEEPQLSEGYDHLITLPPLPPAAEITPALILSLLALLAASPRNSAARKQRQPRPRSRTGPGAAPPGVYSRPGGDGSIDDGTWRPPASSRPRPAHPSHQPQSAYSHPNDRQTPLVWGTPAPRAPGHSWTSPPSWAPPPGIPPGPLDPYPGAGYHIGGHAAGTQAGRPLWGAPPAASELGRSVGGKDGLAWSDPPAVSAVPPTQTYPSQEQAQKSAASGSEDSSRRLGNPGGAGSGPWAAPPPPPPPPPFQPSAT